MMMVVWLWDLTKDLIRAGNPWQICAGLMGLYFGAWAAMIYGARAIRPARKAVTAWVVRMFAILRVVCRVGGRK